MTIISIKNAGSIGTPYIILLVSSSLAFLTTSKQHSLLVQAIAWLLIYTACVYKGGTAQGNSSTYLIGVLLAIGNICERAAGLQNLLWSKALLPILLRITTQPDEQELDRIQWIALMTPSICAAATSYRDTGSNTVVALGLAYTVSSIVTLLALERALSTSKTGIIAVADDGTLLAVIRDASSAAALLCLLASIAWEPWRYEILVQLDLMSAFTIVCSMSSQFAFMLSVVYMIHQETAFTTTLPLLASSAFASVLLSFTFSKLWYLCLTTASITLQGTRVKIGILFIALFSLAYLAYTPQLVILNAGLAYDTNLQYLPVQLVGSAHPIEELTRNADAEWDIMLNRQSTTLDQGVVEYRRRYGMNPPPNFDKWFEFAKSNDVRVLDEYDTIYHSLLPFWALPSATIRARSREALGYRENDLIGILIRDGQVTHIEGGEAWQQTATVGMIETFVQYLPDMDLAFNIHDEPRVVLPYGGLEQLVTAGLAETALADGIGGFSSRPNDLNNGRRIEEVKSTRFNYFPRQHTWSPAKISCPATSPAGSFQQSADNLTAYALGELGYVYNQTAFSDICNSPSLETSHGFFERANSFDVVHDLFPIFSQSKMSCFQDILYPSPWYWQGKVAHQEAEDMSWQEKISKLWWRGSTTGGYSQDGGWRHQHRQQLVKKLQDDLADVRFSSVGQCDPNDCSAQEEYFNIAPASDQQDAWKYKYLFDMDGNAFSGRFYAFLDSHSLVFKMAVFREWHEEWIKPWVHYIPVSLKGDEIIEAVRYMEDTPELGKKIADTSTAFARSSLRRKDFEAWFFRLLLEYGRLVDDNRLTIGYGHVA